MFQRNSQFQFMVGQANYENAFCLAGLSIDGSCNQIAANINFGKAIAGFVR